MPSSATITSFYTFAANTKARANYVNTNFSNYRGHIIAIDPNTATAATTETYDLGSTEYRWRTGYFREVDFKSNTSTGQSLQIVGDTAAGKNAFLLKHAGNTRARLGGGNNYVDLDTTTSQFDFKFNGSTLASITNLGMNREAIKKSTLYSVLLATTGILNVTTTLTKIFELSVTSNGNIGMLTINSTEKDNNGRLVIINSGLGSDGVSIYIYRDGTGVSNLIINETFSINGKATSTADNEFFHINPIYFDTSITAGNHTYYFYAVTGLSTTRINSGANQNRLCFLDII